MPSPLTMSPASYIMPNLPYTVQSLQKSTQAVDASTIDRLVALCILSFDNGNDHWVSSGTGGNVQQADGFFRSRIMATIASPAGHIYAATSAKGVEGGEDPEILGVALWIGPGDALFSTEEQRGAYLDKWNRQLDPDLVEWWNTYQSKPVTQLVKNIRRETWSLCVLAVSPHHRRKGIARNLVEVIQKKAISEGEGVSVPTQSLENVKMYERLGFTVFGDTKIIGGAAGDYTIYFLTFNWPPV